MFTTPQVTIQQDGTMIFSRDWSFCGVTIKEGFPSDGTTSPWWARAVVPRIGKYVYASFLHDYCLTVMPRKEADLKFKEGLVLLKAPK